LQKSQVSTVIMPRKHKIEKDQEVSSEPGSSANRAKIKNEGDSKPDAGDKRVKIKKEEDKLIPLSPRARDRELRVAAALIRLERNSTLKMEANQQTEISEYNPFHQHQLPRNDSVTIKKSIFPRSMMQKIEAMEAAKGDARTGNVVYIATHEHTGRWVDTKFVIIGAYQCFQSANHHIMKYFSELDITIDEDVWEGEEKNTSFDGAFNDQTWKIGLDGCLALYFDDGKWGKHRVYAKRLEIAP